MVLAVCTVAAKLLTLATLVVYYSMLKSLITIKEQTSEQISDIYPHHIADICSVGTLIYVIGGLQIYHTSHDITDLLYETLWL